MATESLSGSCLCGRVRYRAEADFAHFLYCHCSRCRKTSGSAHAANLIASLADTSGGIDWTTGEDAVRRFDIGGSDRFAHCFCADCGGGLPYITRDGQYLVVPAGSLDDEPALRPQARVYWASRAGWADNCDSLPHFDDVPGRRGS